jgi:hypothetical protein
MDASLPCCRGAVSLDELRHERVSRWPHCYAVFHTAPNSMIVEYLTSSIGIILNAITAVFVGLFPITIMSKDGVQPRLNMWQRGK